MTRREKAIYCIALAVWDVEKAAEQATRWGMDVLYLDSILQRVVLPALDASISQPKKEIGNAE